MADRTSKDVKVLCYKSEGRWFDPGKESLEFFIENVLPAGLCPLVRLSLQQEMSTRIFSYSLKRPLLKLLAAAD